MFTTLRSRVLQLLLLLLLPLSPVIQAVAQVTPEATDPPGMTFATTVDDLPATATRVWLLRLTVPPGADGSPTALDGSALVAVEMGQVALTTDQQVTRLGSDPNATPTTVSAGDIVLGSGDAATLRSGSTVSVGNDGPDPALLLVLYVEPVRQDRTRVAASPSPAAVNVEIELISVGRIEFATSSAILIVERDVVRPGAAAVSSTLNGIEIGALEQGSAGVTILSGRNWVWPGIMSTSGADIGPQPMREGSHVSLQAQDRYISIDGSLVWRAGEDETLVILRAQVIPVPVAG